MASEKKTAETYVTITNLERRMRTYNLTSERIRDHPEFGYVRIMRHKSDHNAKTGEVVTRQERHSAPRSITFCAKESKKNLPHVVALTDEIRAAKDRGKLKIEYQDALIQDPVPAQDPKPTVTKIATPPTPAPSSPPAKT